MKRSNSGWPRTGAQLRDDGYRPQGKSFKCPCGRRIFMVRPPLGKDMPMEKRDDERYQPHFASCPLRDSFRRGQGPDRRQGSLFEEPEMTTARYPR